jgi:hypothetical protein
MRVHSFKLKSLLHCCVTELRLANNSAYLAEVCEFACSPWFTTTFARAQECIRVIHNERLPKWFFLLDILAKRLQSFCVVIFNPLGYGFFNVLIWLKKVVVSEVA